MRNCRTAETTQVFPMQKFQKTKKEERKEGTGNIFGRDIFFFVFNPKHRVWTCYFYVENLLPVLDEDISIHSRLFLATHTAHHPQHQLHGRVFMYVYILSPSALLSFHLFFIPLSSRAHTVWFSNMHHFSFFLLCGVQVHCHWNFSFLASF